MFFLINLALNNSFHVLEIGIISKRLDIKDHLIELIYYFLLLLALWA